MLLYLLYRFHFKARVSFRAISEKSSLGSQKFLFLNHAPTRFIDGYSISPEAPNDSWWVIMLVPHKNMRLPVGCARCCSGWGMNFSQKHSFRDATNQDYNGPWGVLSNSQKVVFTCKARKSCSNKSEKMSWQCIAVALRPILLDFSAQEVCHITTHSTW